MVSTSHSGQRHPEQRPESPVQPVVSVDGQQHEHTTAMTMPTRTVIPAEDVLQPLTDDHGVNHGEDQVGEQRQEQRQDDSPGTRTEPADWIIWGSPSLGPGRRAEP